MQQGVAQIPWGHNVVLMDKISNFENRLASPQSELAVQTMKDPYVFDFIPFKEDMVERDIEQAPRLKTPIKTTGSTGGLLHPYKG